MQFLQTRRVIVPKLPALTSIFSVDLLKQPKALQISLLLTSDLLPMVI